MELNYIIIVSFCLLFCVNVGAQIFRGCDNNNAEFTERLGKLETKLDVYEEDRKQLFKYFDTLAEVINRLMKLETKTDNVQLSVTQTRQQLNRLAEGVQYNNISIQNLKMNYKQMKNEVGNETQDLYRTVIDSLRKTKRLERFIGEIDSKTQTLQQNVEKTKNETKQLRINITAKYNESQNQQVTCVEELYNDIQRLQNGMVELRNETQRNDIISNDLEEMKSTIYDHDTRLSIITTNVTKMENKYEQLDRQEIIQRLTYTDDYLTALRFDVNELKKTIGNINMSKSQENEADRPAAHLMGISSNYPRFLKVLGKTQGYPILTWIYNEDLAFTKNVKYRLGRIIIPSNGLYFVYSQMSFRAAYNMNSLSNNLSHSIYRYNIIYPGGGEEKLTQNTITKYWVKSGPPADYTSYLGALFMLRQGDEIFIKVSDTESVVTDPKMNYFGLFKLS